MWRLIVTGLVFLLSLLTIVKAPTNFFWRVAVAVTEFPYFMITLSLTIVVLSFWSVKYKGIVISLSLVAFIFSCLPVIKAYAVGNKLKTEFEKIFPYTENKDQLQSPFGFFTMFSGIGIKQIEPEIISYKSLTEKKLVFDYYRSGKEKAPCIVVIHGGSWREGDSKQLPDLNGYLANRGYNVAAINYRLAPKYKSPAQVEDTRDVIKYITDNAATLKVDTNNFVLLGRSAGGQIALCAAYDLKDPKIKGVITYYAPADMVWGGTIKGNKLVLNTDKVFTDYLGGLIKDMPEKYKESSAFEKVNQNSTPTLIIHGEIDAMVSYEHSRHLNEKLEENKVKHYFLSLPNSTHGCDYNINGPSGQLTTYAVERFIKSLTGY